MDWLGSLWEAFGDFLQTVLPLSPFQQYVAAFRDLPYLGWLNWLVPVRAMLVIMAAWLGTVATFYLWSILMRWLKVIGD